MYIVYTLNLLNHYALDGEEFEGITVYATNKSIFDGLDLKSSDAMSHILKIVWLACLMLVLIFLSNILFNVFLFFQKGSWRTRQTFFFSLSLDNRFADQ